MKKLCLACLLAAGLLAASAANAGIAITSNVAVVAKPPVATLGVVEGPNARVWLENVVVRTSLQPQVAVNHDGSSGNFEFATDLTGTTLGAGTYQSYMIHFDPVGQAGTTTRGSVTFDLGYKIVGVALFPGVGNGINTLGATDSIFGLGTAYDTNSVNRGLELNGQDSFTISADGRTFSFLNFPGTTDQFFAAEGQDQVRLLVQAVPEFTTVFGWATLACLGFAAYRRYQR